MDEQQREPLSKEAAPKPRNEEELREPDEVLLPPPFRDPNDFAPIPPPRATLRDVVELVGHIVFVITVTVVIPVTLVWLVYRLYRWLPFETMALVIAGLASAWAYRDRLGALLRRVFLGRDRSGSRP